jgi:hypothetical protein
MSKCARFTGAKGGHSAPGGVPLSLFGLAVGKLINLLETRLLPGGKRRLMES